MSEPRANIENTSESPPRTPSGRRLGRTVVALGFVSLFTDISSEMVYTQIPLFLTLVLGAPKWAVGLIEGIAESTASLLRLVSGHISDRMGARKPLTIAGYGFGAISKPLLFLATGWPMVLALRFLDRMGKGLRTAPRDALITETTPQELRGRAFGLHRTMDTTGAVLGPLLGIWFLSVFHGTKAHQLRALFLFAGLPGLLAVITLLVFVREKTTRSARGTEAQRNAGEGKEKAQNREVTSEEQQNRPAIPEIENRKPKIENPLLSFWKELQPSYRRFLLITFLFNLGNSSDAFLILRANQLGFDSTLLLWLYAAFNVVEAALGYAAGILSDRVGRRPLIIVGYGVFALVYAGFALITRQNYLAVWGLFLLYGGYYTLTQGTQRAFAADLSDPAKRATQIGAYHTVVGVALLPASIIAGRLFDWNPSAPFAVGAVTGVLSAALLAGQFRTLPSRVQ